MTPYLHTNIPQGLWGIESNNHVYGMSWNPYKPGFVSGGSSGGECALVRVRGSAFGLGSDSAGSVRIPASFCGVFSFKPSGSRRFSRRGRVALGGDEIQVVKEIDACMGFITKCVADLEFLLQRTLGRSIGDRNWLVSGPWQQDRYDQAVNKKMTFGYMLETN